MPLYVDSRINTGVLLSLNSHKTEGLEGGKAPGQCVAAAQQSYDWRGVEPGNSVSLHVNSRKAGVLLSINWRTADGVSLPVDSRKTAVLLALNSLKSGNRVSLVCTSTVVRLACSCLSTAI